MKLSALSSAIVMSTLALGSMARAADTTTDTYVSTATVSNPVTYGPAAATPVADPMALIPTSIFKLGNSAFHAQAQWFISPKLDLGTAHVNRTDTCVTIDVSKDHVEICRDPHHPSLVDIDWRGHGHHQAQVHTAHGAFVADTVDKKLRFALTPLADGRYLADARGVLPGTAHLYLTPQ